MLNSKESLGYGVISELFHFGGFIGANEELLAAGNLYCSINVGAYITDRY